MRLLLDERGPGLGEAWDVTKRTLAYTNHTLLPEALERWPVDWIHLVAPRQLEIIYRDQSAVARRPPRALSRRSRAMRPRRAWSRKARLKPCAWPILRSSARTSTNGVAAIHSNLLRDDDGPRPRGDLSRAVQQQDQRGNAAALAAARQSVARDDDFERDRRRLDRRPRRVAEAAAAGGRPGVPRRHSQSPTRVQGAVCRLAPSAHTGRRVDPDAIFDCQIKRIHEYKRQLLNALRIVVLYDRLRANPNDPVDPRTFFFAGKAAPAYRLAKVIIKFINNLARTLDERSGCPRADSRSCSCPNTTSRWRSG